MRILYVGPTFRGSNTTSWRDAFIRLEHEVRSVDSFKLASWPVRLDRRLIARMRRHPGTEKMRLLNQAVVQASRDFRPNLIFLAHGEYITAATIRYCRQFGLVFAFMGDDIMNPINRSATFDEVIAEVDCILTTNSWNVPELRAAGVSRVEYSPWAYDPDIHFPAPITASDRLRFACDIGFVGTFRPERADYLERVVSRCPGLVTRIWGGEWRKMRRWLYRIPRTRWPRLRASVTPEEVWCEDYSKAIQSAGIVLGLLNHANRDLHTARTFEIPACGGFMLAERTPEHQLYFEEDREAVYFGDLAELIDKIDYYSRNDTERRKIAAAGYQRCIGSGYQYIDRARAALNVFDEMGGGVAHRVGGSARHA